MQGFSLSFEDAFCLRQHDRWQICKIFIKCVICMAGFSFIFEDAFCLRQHDRWQICKILIICQGITYIFADRSGQHEDKLYEWW